MAPQQIEGRRPQATDDIYSLGATFYDLLTGTPPFYLGEIIHQVLNAPPTPMDERLRELGAANDIPDYVGAMVMACLQKDPDKRPVSAAAIRKWIVSALLHQSLVAGDAPAPLYTQRTVDFYRIARQPVTGRWRALPLHTPGVFPGDPRDDSARENHPPQCRIRADRLRGKAPMRVQFRADAQDPGGRIAWQTWDFDASDGVAVDSAKAAPSWKFIKPGHYTVSLTVMDNFLSSAHAHVVVTVEP